MIILRIVIFTAINNPQAFIDPLPKEDSKFPLFLAPIPIEKLLWQACVQFVSNEPQMASELHNPNLQI